MKLEFSQKIFKKTEISIFMRIHPLGAELSHVDGQTDRHNEADSHFSQFCKCT